ncbi:hypothetical protein [Streptomyces sp. ISL-100]|uniref:hypothetical protein n=1 Tax=Streptomyces sp. ISL-100 TaxID=2819173 RepID=UPI001BE9319F|nr:hypothetical protein [Streptomyces sp. ISL-100]MBT2395401.1 hypothetical protein [Streptomyces sp. ISL-100]
MKHLPKWAAISALAVTATIGGTTAASAGMTSHQKVDGKIVVGDDTCTWTDAATSANAPAALTVDRATVNKPGGNLSCDGDVSATLNNDPAFTFDDATGTATADIIDITGRQGFISCRYKATNVQWDREGTTRNYTNRPFTAPKVSGSSLCPSSVDADAGDASMLFH